MAECANLFWRPKGPARGPILWHRTGLCREKDRRAGSGRSGPPRQVGEALRAGTDRRRRPWRILGRDAARSNKELLLHG